MISEFSGLVTPEKGITKFGDGGDGYSMSPHPFGDGFSPSDKLHNQPEKKPDKTLKTAILKPANSEKTLKQKQQDWKDWMDKKKMTMSRNKKQKQ